MKKTFGVCLFLCVIMIILVVISTSSPSSTLSTSPPSSTQARLVFASDFATDEGCADHSSTDACDLFTANLDLDAGSVDDVKQVTETPEISESYPVWNPNGMVVYASVFETITQKLINYVDLTTGVTDTLLSLATWPEVSPEGTTLLYVTSDTDRLMSAALTLNGLSISESSALTEENEQGDPDYAPDGHTIILHEILDDGAHGVILDTQTGDTATWENKSGHCAFSPSGTLTVCDNSKGGGLFARSWINGSLGESSLFLADLKPEALTKYDPVFSSCEGASFNYPTFCGDDEHLLVSTSCNTDTKGTVSFSRLFFIDLSQTNPIYHPIGLALDEAFDGPGMSSWTVDCLLL